MALALGTLTWVNGISIVRSGVDSPDGVPVGMAFFMGSIMLLAAAGDVRMLVVGGLVAPKRLARHLWRMCFGLFIAAGSFFLGPSNRPLRLLSAAGLRQHLPPALFSTTLYLVLTLLPLVLLVYWLAPVRLTAFPKQSQCKLRPLIPSNTATGEAASGTALGRVQWRAVCRSKSFTVQRDTAIKPRSRVS